MRKPPSFSTDLFPKNAGKNTTFFGVRLVRRIFEEFKQPAIQANKVQRFGRFFLLQIIVRQRIGRKDSLQAACRRVRLESFFYLEAQNFKLFLKIKNHGGGQENNGKKKTALKKDEYRDENQRS